MQPSGWSRNSISDTPTSGRPGPLLGLPGDLGGCRFHRVDPRLAGRHEHVGDGAPGRRPRGHSGRRAPLDVVGMGGDHRRPLPAVGELLQVHPVDRNGSISAPGQMGEALGQRRGAEAAVDDEGLAGDVRGLVREQEERPRTPSPSRCPGGRAAPASAPATAALRGEAPSAVSISPGATMLARIAAPLALERRRGARARRAPPSRRRRPGSGYPA